MFSNGLWVIIDSWCLPPGVLGCCVPEGPLLVCGAGSARCQGQSDVLGVQEGQSCVCSVQAEHGPQMQP